MSTFFDELTDESDIQHREMAIDCPDSFIPEIKTKPIYPPVNNQSSKHLLTFINPKQKEPKTQAENKNMSFSSIQFIDDDTKSKLNLTPTPQIEKFHSSKKLFECGLINDGFEMELEESSSISKLTQHRAPTPPKPVNTSNFSCINIQTETKFDECSRSLNQVEDISKQIDLIQTKFEEFKLNSEDGVDLLKTCSHDLETIRGLVKTNDFKNTLNLYNKLISINGTYDLKPVCANVSNLLSDVSYFLFFCYLGRKNNTRFIKLIHCKKKY